MNDITKNLDKLGVPGVGLTWKRILQFANDFSLYKASISSLVDDPIDSLEPENIVLSEDQNKAWNKILKWVDNTNEPYFILKGYAGTGKSFLLKQLSFLPHDIYFTAPTNKATKVLSKFVEAEAKTIYSLLGIRMTQVDDHLELTLPEKPPYFPKHSIIVVDEASMVGHKLFEFIKETVLRLNCKVLYVGDPAQIPPVGEAYTKAWKATNKPDNNAFLKKVMRYDNQLLKLATNIRDNLIAQNYESPIVNDNDGNEGVFLLKGRKSFIRELESYTSPSDFTKTKVIAWRNKTVNKYNSLIRDNLGFKEEFCIGDVILLAEPVEIDGQIIATIDDEYVVESVMSSTVTIRHHIEIHDIPVWKLLVGFDNEELQLNIPKSYNSLDHVLSMKAMAARNENNSLKRRRYWKDFWDTKRKFHKVRYGYAITSHRAQGSTYETVFVDQDDILVNSNEKEAMRCLYVACTRPTKAIVTY